MEPVLFDFAKPDFPLAPRTWYRVGGPARLALEPENIAEAAAAYAWMCAQHAPQLILGGGSNVLISDVGFPGNVLLTSRLNTIQPLGGDRFRVDAGVVLATLVREVMLANNYEGVGGLTGIPGTAGGAMFMNAGTVNGSTCQWLESVELAGPDGPRRIEIEPGDYAYRHQDFCPPGSLILGGVIRFARSQDDQRAVYEHYMQRRREKQPQGYCCGSVFKNPEGDHAGRLIEACGLKGKQRGGAVVSPMHANFIMNEDHASFDDILGLINEVKATVHARFGVTLEEEVRIIAPGREALV